MYRQLRLFESNHSRSRVLIKSHKQTKHTQCTIRHLGHIEVMSSSFSFCIAHFKLRRKKTADTLDSYVV